MYHSMHMESEDSFQESALSSRHVGDKEPTQVLGDKLLILGWIWSSEIQYSALPASLGHEIHLQQWKGVGE